MKVEKGGFIRYIGAKNRLARHIAPHLHATGADCLVDVFGGSGAVSHKAGFGKRIYNDVDGDLVCLFRVMSDSSRRAQLLRSLRWLPPSREVFCSDYQVYSAGGFSFRSVEDDIERARMVFYRGSFCFGGKMRCGGFQVSFSDRPQIKELARYRQVLRDFAAWGAFWQGTVIENMDYRDLISTYGRRDRVVLYVDPPYVGTEQHYSRRFSASEHAVLAQQLAAAKAPSVVSYYDEPLIRELYPSDCWDWNRVEVTKNSGKRGAKQRVEEVILVRRVRAS